MAEKIGHFPPHQKDQIVDVMFSVARSNLQASSYARASETVTKIVDANIAMTRSDVLDVHVDGAYLIGQPTATDGIVFAALNGIRNLVKDEEDVSSEARSPLYIGGTPETARVIKAMVGAHDTEEVPVPPHDYTDKVLSDRLTRSKTNMGFILYERKTVFEGGAAKGGIRKTSLEAVIPPWPAVQIKPAA